MHVMGETTATERSKRDRNVAAMRSSNHTTRTPSGAVKEVILRVTECAQKEVSHPARDRVCTKRSHSARRSRIWTLLYLVIAQKKIHLRGIELETSSLECIGATAATNQA
jgi:hypothetical protein